MPSDEQMLEYGNKLPGIYRDIIFAFAEIQQRRYRNHGFSFQTIAMHFINTNRSWTTRDVNEAAHNLCNGGFFSALSGMFLNPSDLGEQLISVMTGFETSSVKDIPDLPKPPWEK